jgi:hypothetical protein
MLLWLLPSAFAHPIELHWYASDQGGGYEYVFQLQAVEPFAGNVDAIVFADVGNTAPAGAEGFPDYALEGDPPAPFDFLDYATGTHEGPLFQNHPSDGWIVADVGDTLTWRITSSALLADDAVYWSNTRGDTPRAEFELAIFDCRLADEAPLADRQGSECAGMTKVCDEATLHFVEPDYAATITGFEDLELACDGVDNDCNGVTDDVADPPLADVQEGVCAGATQVCAGGVYEEPDYAAIPGYEATESLCDAQDNDCNGAVDDLPGAPPATKQEGVCEGAFQVCDGAGGWTDPDYTQILLYEPAEASCDTFDNDCDGETDNLRQCLQYSGGCGCTSGTGGGGVLAAIAALLLLGLRWRR